MNVNIEGGLFNYLIAALLFSMVNAVIRPVLVVIAMPAIILSLGLFVLIISGGMVWLTSNLYGPFTVNTFGAAILTAIIIWIVNHGLNLFFASSRLEVVE